jgi:site-specific DNA-methyltransferase (adenine-specific)
VCKPSAAIVLTAAQPFTSVLVCSNLKEFKYDWVWQKERGTGHLNAKKAPLRDKEDVLVFCQTTPLYLPQMKLGEPYKDKCGKNKSANFGADKREGNDNSGFRYPTTVLNFQGSSSKDKVHPTQKPVALMEYLIKTYTNEGELVLDNTMGSGTTGVACGNLGRKFIGIEQDEKYFKIAQSRISAAYPNDDFC